MSNRPAFTLAVVPVPSLREDLRVHVFLLTTGSQRSILFHEGQQDPLWKSG